MSQVSFPELVLMQHSIVVRNMGSAVILPGFKAQLHHLGKLLSASVSLSVK